MTSRTKNEECDHTATEDLLLHLEKMISDLGQAIAEQNSLLRSVNEIKDRIDNIESLLIAGFGHTKKQLKTIDSNTSYNFKELNSELPTLVNQQIQLSKFFESGEIPLSFEGWTIAPDLAIRLITDVTLHKFDGIVEFGSGLSTCLLAKLSSSNPCKLFSFEHHKEYFAKTSNLLETLNLDSRVNLIYGKLRNVSYENFSYRFYTCIATLKRMAKGLNASSKVMVLVDGPPGNTNNKARFPALPLILDCFPNCTIHVYLDDFNRAQEQEIIADWESILISKNIKFEKEIVDLKKGLCILKIYRNEQQGIEDEPL
ncbi:MAG: hypothetical protein Altm2KO_20400 [Alteromonas macleodii]|uniref:hypothetical protein n=1 Tax=Alteromonas TaxID=226 RepID=UPI00127904F2|nr:hypothetical protein [Alteromonas macleodii]MDM7962183.1 hypothetical protein [Alteromonas macleodii]CAI3967642.1 hypothetical protein EZ55_03571 [Alteromonas macleodii]VTP57483.1 hypothetical protein EZ55_03571 [Alteromonas macleodii]